MGPCRPSAGKEQRDRIRGEELPGLSSGVFAAERRHRIVGLAGRAERLTTGREEPQPRAGREERLRELGAGVAHMLAVVQQKQHLRLA